MTFEQFVSRQVAALVRIAAALTGDRGLAEDLVQDVLIKAHHRWDRIGMLEAPESYVRRMVVNEFTSWRRKWARIVPTDDLLPADAGPDHAEAHADRQLLDQQLSGLPRRQQVVLALRYYEGLADAQIAEILGCQVATVRSLASRALAALRVDPALRCEFAPAHPKGRIR